MGYHHCHIPDLKELMEQFDKLGLEGFVKKYKACLTLIGSTDSIEYLESKVNEYINIAKEK
jgi:hypothetical protein